GLSEAMSGWIFSGMASTVGRVGPEDFHEQTSACDFFDGFLDPLFLNMPFDVDEENVLPGFSSGRPRFNLGQAEAVRGKRPEEVVQGTDFVFHREHQGSLIFSCTLG